MNAIELLKEDHNRVSRLFQKVKADTEGKNHKKLFEQIREELEIHTHIEETVFYPQIKQEKEIEELVLEGIEEHHQVKMFLRELGNLVEDSEKFDPKLNEPERREPVEPGRTPAATAVGPRRKSLFPASQPGIPTRPPWPTRSPPPNRPS